MFLAIMVLDIITPTIGAALTAGPRQPESGAFEQVTSSNMVNTFNGDFSYNIPLLSIPGPDGGYPINLAYQSNVGMDQEASWVGLGWLLNVGAINRQMKVFPDEFNGDEVEIKVHGKQDKTVGVGLSKSFSPQFGGQDPIAQLSFSKGMKFLL